MLSMLRTRASKDQSESGRFQRPVASRADYHRFSIRTHLQDLARTVGWNRKAVTRTLIHSDILNTRSSKHKEKIDSQLTRGHRPCRYFHSHSSSLGSCWGHVQTITCSDADRQDCLQRTLYCITHVQGHEWICLQRKRSI